MAEAQVEMQPYRRFSLAERDRRWKAIRELMARDHLDALVAPPNLGNSTDWQADARCELQASRRGDPEGPGSVGRIDQGVEETSLTVESFVLRSQLPQSCSGALRLLVP